MIREVLQIVILAADSVGILLILIGFLLALWQLIPMLVHSSPKEEILGIQAVRCRLGSFLVLGLEFMIVSDLVQSVLSHSLKDLYLLGALVVLRTMIGFFLNREIRELAEDGGHA